MSNRGDTATAALEGRERRVDELIATIAGLRSPEEAGRFLRDLCTRHELEAMAQRWDVARLVDQGAPYLEIARRTGASTATITRVAQWVHHGEGGYREVIERGAK